VPESKLEPGNCAEGAKPFVTTRWSVVLRAGQDESPEALAAMESLCRAYWYPIYAHARRRGRGPEDARDAAQEFFASLLRHDSIARVRRERGRFRTFLLSSLDYFLADQNDRARAAKRGGGVAPVELDALDAEECYALEPASGEAPDKAFDRRWVAVLVQRSVEVLAAENEAAGRSKVFERLKGFLERETEVGEYEAVGAALGMTPNAVAAAVRRLRVRLREILLEEAAHTVGTPGEAEEELRQLFS